MHVLTPEWREVPGLPGYFANELGQMLGRYGRILKPGPCGTGRKYLMIHCSLGSKSKRQAAMVHRCVALAFLGEPPTPLHEVAHNDGNPHNNRLSNLRWATHKENSADRWAHGTQVHGEGVKGAKLTAEQVAAMRRRCGEGDQQRTIALEYGISESHLCNIVKQKRWKTRDGANATA